MMGYRVMLGRRKGFRRQWVWRVIETVSISGWPPIDTEILAGGYACTRRGALRQARGSVGP